MIYEEISFKITNMDILLPLCFLLLLVPISKAANDHDHQHCPISKCSHDGPLIRFPFRLHSDPLHCGNSEFEVSCSRSNSSNMTMIRLSSSSGLFPIQTIDYENRTFDVYDGDGCLARRLLNFTISSSLYNFYTCTMHYSRALCLQYFGTCFDSCGPSYHSEYYSPALCRQYFGTFFDSRRPPYYNSYFESYLSLDPRKFKEFTLLNCSTTKNFSIGSSYYIPITCLSVPGHHQVLAVEPSTSINDLPVSTCTTLKTQFLLPLRRVDGDTNQCAPDNVLSLEWEPESSFPECLHCTGTCEFDNRRNQMECYPAFLYPDPPQKPKGMQSNYVPMTSLIILNDFEKKKKRFFLKDYENVETILLIQNELIQLVCSYHIIQVTHQHLGQLS